MINNTWEFVALPVGKKTITSKWVYQVKQKLDGSLKRFRSRLPIRPFTQ